VKVVAFVGSTRKKHTYHSTEKFLQNLQSLGEVEYELVHLIDFKLEICRGCKVCLDKGEELCPLKDDRDKLFEKIEHADGVVFATPNYSFNVSGLMKVFLDRFGFIFHRPRFFGKTCTSIVAEGVYGGRKIIKYFNFIGKALGFNVVNGSVVTTREPITEKTEKKNNRTLEGNSQTFYAQLVKKELPTPSLFDLMFFRMARSGIKRDLDESFRDYTYFREQGWFESDFYYPVKLNPLKKMMGNFFDKMKMK
jgi:multimeric flavodoxin WrbA